MARIYQVESARLPRMLTDPGGVRALVQADCKDVLRLCPSGWATVVHTSPPYNIGRRYKDFLDARHIDQYQRFLNEVISELSRVLEPGGSVFWQTGYTERRSEPSARANGGILLLDSLSLPIFSQCGFTLWDRIVWNYFGSMAFKSKFTNRHETILWLVKAGPNGASPEFDLDEVRERALSYDGRNHILGRNPGNVWQAERVAYGSTGQTTHPAVFPEEISEKIVRSCSRPDEVVLDPFVGSGTACKVALTLGRQFLGCDISEGYVREADQRLGLWARGELRNLALGLIVLYAFQGKPGIKTIAELDGFLCLACRGGVTNEIVELEALVRELESPSRVTRGIKQEKQQVWKRHDDLIKSKDPPNAIVGADRALSFCFAHRKRWNGVRRYLSAGLLLKNLGQQILGQQEPTREEFIRELCLQAPTRFGVSGNQVALKRADAGLGCNTSATQNLAPGEFQTVLF